MAVGNFTPVEAHDAFKLIPAFDNARVIMPQVCRRVDTSDFSGSPNIHGIPQSGDLVLCRVEKVGEKSSIASLGHGNLPLKKGHYVIGVLGARYATDQYEAHIPQGALPEELHLVGAGGIVSVVESQDDANMAEGPTVLTPVGFLRNKNGEKINLKQYAFSPRKCDPANAPPIISFFGSSMNSGKSTTCANMTEGLTAAGKKVGYVKLTGTSFPGDPRKQIVSGAIRAYDFVNFGHGSTFGVPVSELEDNLETAVEVLKQDGCDVIMVEVADGLDQQETEALLNSERFSSIVDAMVLSGADPGSAYDAYRTVKEAGNAPALLGISGLCTSGSLKVKELERKRQIKEDGIPVYTAKMLKNPQIALDLLDKTPKGAHWSFETVRDRRSEM